MSEPWYAVQCKANQDGRAEVELARQGYEVFRPKVSVRKKGRARIESFFPRYLFIRLSETVHSFATVRSTRGVLKLVGWGGVVPTVPDGVVDTLRACLDATGCIARKHVLGASDPVRVTDGPFAGLCGRFLECSGQERVIVLLELMSRQQVVTLPNTMVEPVY